MRRCGSWTQGWPSATAARPTRGTVRRAFAYVRRWRSKSAAWAERFFEVSRRAQRKAIEMRSQGWSGAAMLPYSELEYGGFRDTVSALLKRFRLREGRKPEAAE